MNHYTFFMQTKYAHLTALLDHMAARYPDAIALKDARSSYTYAVLSRISRSMAAALAQGGVKPGEKIVCLTRKNSESILGFWAILAAGATAVLLDQDDGQEANKARISSMGASVLIHDGKEQALPVDLPGIQVFSVEQLMTDARHNNATAAAKVPDNPTGICYILMTSGTTGKPKAIQITHANILHYTQAIYDRLGMPGPINAAHVSTFAADLGLTNLVVALASGGMLRILNKLEASDPATFSTIISHDRIDLLKITPSHFSSLVAGKKSPFEKPIDTIIFGGEKLSWSLVHQVYTAGLCRSVYNHYGPTETTVGALAYKVRFDQQVPATASVPIGTPLGAGVCFIDAPAGDVGELYIAGPGLSPGYLNNEEETQKRFLEKIVNGQLMTCYRTGDRCKQYADGNFEFLYRTDRQAKIKGYRVELGEIELAIAGHPHIEKVAVEVAAHQEYNRLEAYIKPKHGQQLSAEEMRNWLSQQIESYKIPSQFYFYTEAPYNANGKIDLAALRNQVNKENGYAGHVGTDEAIQSWAGFAGIAWKEILRKEAIAPADNFFDAGGDSLLAIQLIGKIQRAGYNMHIMDLHKHPVFQDFAALDPVRLDHGTPEYEGQRRAQPALTWSQHLYLQQKTHPVNTYCQTILLETSGKIRLREMAIAIQEVVKSHTQLLTAFRHNRPFSDTGRINAFEQASGISILDNRTSTLTQIQEINKKLLGEIAIEQGKIFNAHVFVDPLGKDYLQFICHHIAVDVISWNILISEVLETYYQLAAGNMPRLTPENVQRAFYDQLATTVTNEAMLPDPFAEAICSLPVPVNGAAHRSAIGVQVLVFEGQAARLLQQVEDPQKNRGVNGLLLSALARSVASVFDLPAISVDVEFHGRPNDERLPDLSRAVGWWSTTLPVLVPLNNAEPSACFAAINKVADIGNNINRYQYAQALTRPGIPDIRLNYLGHFPVSFGKDDLQLLPADFNPGFTRSNEAQQEYKLFVTARFMGDRLIIDMQYQETYFPGPVIEAVVTRFKTAVLQYLQGAGAPPFLPAPRVLKSNIPSVGQPLFNVPAGNDKPAQATVKNVLLTGATGFLGIHLLKELLGQDNTHVYCLVRGEHEAQAKNRLIDVYDHYFDDGDGGMLAKITVLCGNIQQGQLGLNGAVYTALVQAVDMVIHAAADINLLKNYAELAATNNHAIENILQVVNTGKPKSLHYISTLAVSGYSKEAGFKNFSESDFYYGQSFVSDYERTKYEGEKIVRDFLDGGGAGKVYRVGHIAADSVHGKFQRNIHQNRLFQVIKGAMLLKKVVDAYDEKISFSYVDIVAKGIVNIALEKVVTDMHCVHLENAEYIEVGKVIRLLNKMGYQVEVVNKAQYLTALMAYEGSNSDKQVLELMDTWIRRAMDFPRKINYVQKRSLDLIGRSGLYFPRLRAEWIYNMVREGIKANYFPAPYKPELDKIPFEEY